MSFQAMAWASTQRCANAGQKLVLLMLANCCNHHTQQCNPSHQRLADECCMGVSTLKSHLAALEAAGVIRIVARAVEGRSMPNHYALCMQENDPPGSQILTGEGPDSDRGRGQILATSKENLEEGTRKRTNTRAEQVRTASMPTGFAVFWTAWPDTERKANRKGCLALWDRKGLEREAQSIIDHVNTLKTSKTWVDGYEPAPVNYLKQERWKDGVSVQKPASEIEALFERFGQ